MWTEAKTSTWRDELRESLTDQMGTRVTRPSMINRRDMLRRMCGGFGLVGLAGLLGPQMLFADNKRAPHFKPRAKRVIFLFMNGGPSHVDTFDPKPALQKFACLLYTSDAADERSGV